LLAMCGGQVDAITIALPRKVLEVLERRSAAEGRAVEARALRA
jgi:hypothetical protein